MARRPFATLLRGDHAARCSRKDRTVERFVIKGDEAGSSSCPRLWLVPARHIVWLVAFFTGLLRETNTDRIEPLPEPRHRCRVSGRGGRRFRRAPRRDRMPLAATAIANAVGEKLIQARQDAHRLMPLRTDTSQTAISRPALQRPDLNQSGSTRQASGRLPAGRLVARFPRRHL